MNIDRSSAQTRCTMIWNLHSIFKPTLRQTRAHLANTILCMYKSHTHTFPVPTTGKSAALKTTSCGLYGPLQCEQKWLLLEKKEDAPVPFALTEAQYKRHKLCVFLCARDIPLGSLIELISQIMLHIANFRFIFCSFHFIEITFHI